MIGSTLRCRLLLHHQLDLTVENVQEPDELVDRLAPVPSVEQPIEGMRADGLPAPAPHTYAASVDA
jgi:hypothetical protein